MDSEEVEMDALCPHCGGKGCEKCKNTGKIQVKLKGPIFEKVCMVCNGVIGGGITHNPKTGEFMMRDGWEDYREDCVFCEAKDSVKIIIPEPVELTPEEEEFHKEMKKLFGKRYRYKGEDNEGNDKETNKQDNEKE